MTVKIENIIVGFTCPECEGEQTSGLDALVVVGVPMCPECDVEMDADSDADVLSDDDEDRYWIHDTLVEDQPNVPLPFGVETVGLVDELAGGVILYMHESRAPEVIKAFRGAGA